MIRGPLLCLESMLGTSRDCARNGLAPLTVILIIALFFDDPRLGDNEANVGAKPPDNLRA